MTNVFLDINYDEITGTGYKSVDVHYNKNIIHFDSGDPELDWKNAVTMAIVLAEENRCRIMSLSSCDHFVMDVEGWRYNENDMLVRDER